jgi:hypothetical protein
MKEVLGLIAVLLTLTGHFPYITDILKGKTKPHLFTWIVWSIVTLLAFLGQWQKGGGAGAWATGVTGIITALITLLAIKNGSRDITRIDKICFTVALISIIPWYITHDPTISVVIVTFIDVFAILPTIRKTLRDPGSETLFTYALNVLRHTLSVIALERYNLATYLYPATLIVLNAGMTLIILLSRKKK